MRGFRSLLQAAASLTVVIAAVTACGAGQPADTASTVVHTDSGPVRGVDRGDELAYMGIPYAAAPTGDLRWRPPQRPDPWADELDATEFGNFCPQNADLGAFGQPGGDEDCLNLNVFVSKKAAQRGRPLPVLVWIHGGSLFVGAGRDYDATKLATDGEAVVVTINYRLGVLGWFANPSIDREGHSFGNYGMLDQQLALDWVQRNISEFGGDPGNVTISGESSGGASVLGHVVSPLSAGKFQHAIPMSGGAVALRFPAFGAPKPLEWAREQGVLFANAVGCDSQSPACLRELSVDEILAAQRPYLINQAILDTDTVPVHPGDALQSGEFNRATLINGTTWDEGTFFAAFPENESGVPMTAQEYPNAMAAYFGANTQEVIAEYPLNAYVSPSNALATAVTDMLFACPARAINRWASDKTPTYAFEFADRTAPSYLDPTTFGLGAAHTFELSYLFPGFRGGAGNPTELNDLQEHLSDRMVGFWSTASRAGEREAQWPRYRGEEDNYLSLTLPEPVMTSGGFADIHNCDYWDQTGSY